MEAQSDYKEWLALLNKHAVDYFIGGIPVFFIGRNEFIANKRALGRKKDLADIEALGEE